MIRAFHVFYELDGSEEPTPSRYLLGVGIVDQLMEGHSATMLPETITRCRSVTADLRERAGADALIVSCPATGHPLNDHDLRQVRQVLPQTLIEATHPRLLPPEPHLPIFSNGTGLTPNWLPPPIINIVGQFTSR